MTDNQFYESVISHLESIKTGPGDLILTIREAKARLKAISGKPRRAKCKYCNGEGHIVSYGHDCWGGTEKQYDRCTVCNGTGMSYE